MTKKEMFRAVGEVREDQILDAAEKRGRAVPWRRYLAAVACLAIVVTAALALPGLRHGWAGPKDESAADQGAEAADGTWDGQDAPMRPSYSVNAEIAELGGVPEEDGKIQFSEDMEITVPTQEALLARDTVIFRGTVRSLRYFEVTAGGMRGDFTVAAVEVRVCIRGDLEAGDIYNVLFAGVPNREGGPSGILADLEPGSEAIFMPFVATAETGWQSGEDYFCYADLAELYFSEGELSIFLDTGKGVSFDRNVYKAAADAATLDDVEAYLREQMD